MNFVIRKAVCAYHSTEHPECAPVTVVLRRPLAHHVRLGNVHQGLVDGDPCINVFTQMLCDKLCVSRKQLRCVTALPSPALAKPQRIREVMQCEHHCDASFFERS